MANILWYFDLANATANCSYSLVYTIQHSIIIIIRYHQPNLLFCRKSDDYWWFILPTSRSENICWWKSFEDWTTWVPYPSAECQCNKDKPMLVTILSYIKLLLNYYSIINQLLLPSLYLWVIQFFLEIDKSKS